MTATTEIHPAEASVGESVDPNEHWRTAWVLLGGALVALAALNAFALWIESGGFIDPEAVIASEPAFQTMFRYFGLEFMGDSLGFGALLVFSALALSRDHSNRFAWILGGSVVSWMTGTALIGLAMLSVAGAIPAAMAPGLTWSGEAAYAVFGFGLMLMIAVFPNGRLPAGPWRRALLTASSVTAIAGLVRLLVPGPMVSGINSIPTTFDNPLGIGFLSGFNLNSVELAEIALPVAAVASLVRTYVRSGPEVRHQVKWIVAVVPIMVAASGLMSFIETPWEGLPATVALWLFAVALGVAITKYRLYDIDVIINRALVFGLLVGFISLVYAGVVVGVGSIVGGSDVGWSIAATALVAVVFEPVRSRVQRWVNRLVYGRRATPYEVLSDLTGRLTETEREEGLLDRMALRLAEGTGADRAVVWMNDGTGLAPAACEPAHERPAGTVRGLEQLPGEATPISHEGELLGALTVETRRGDSLTPTERRLVEDLAGSAGLLMRRLRLDAALEQKALELEESRRRLVSAQDVERRRLERELNDGPQRRVLALQEHLASVERTARNEGADTAAGLIAQMSAETRDAIEQIRALANGIYPPLLEAEGLPSALSALAEVAPVDVQMSVDVHGRHPLPIEGAIYFCISEAMTNAVKHGNPPIQIELSDRSGELTFSVSDAGPGFDLDGVERGSGLNNMTDRLEALNGSVTIESAPGRPTVVTGHVAMADEAGAA